MKYMFLVVQDEQKYEALSASEKQALDDSAIDYAGMLQDGGHMVGANALELTPAATTVRIRDGVASVTDGPYMETYEQVGGFLMVEARDLNQAIELAAKMPCAFLGGIEVRPVRELVSSTNPERRIY